LSEGKHLIRELLSSGIIPRDIFADCGFRLFESFVFKVEANKGLVVTEEMKKSIESMYEPLQTGKLAKWAQESVKANNWKELCPKLAAAAMSTPLCSFTGMPMVTDFLEAVKEHALYDLKIGTDLNGFGWTMESSTTGFKEMFESFWTEMMSLAK